jgi:dephospho-CoA kinase
VIPQSIRVLLIGGIGTGKSTLARFLAERGAVVIDADEVGHQVLEAEAFEAVAARWPEVVVDGRIDRQALGAIVFGDALQLRELEAITHPAIRSRILSRVAEAESEIVVVQLPLLEDFLGSGWVRVVIVADREARVARLLGRGMTLDRIEAVMETQPDEEEWVAAADLVVDNSGPLEQLPSQAEELLARIRRVSRTRLEDPPELAAPQP